MSDEPIDEQRPVLERPALWWMAGLLLILIPILVMAQQRPADLPPPLAHLPNFELVDQEARTVRGEDLQGQVVVLDFIFTRCPDVCPIMSSRMARLAKRLKRMRLKGHPITLVSVSVDPDYDTPSVLSLYADRFEADSNRWRFLTGPQEEIDSLLGALMLAAVVDPNMNDDGGVPTIAHSQRFVLIDASGGVRAFYAPHAGETDQLVGGIRALVVEEVGTSR